MSKIQDSIVNEEIVNKDSNDVFVRWFQNVRLICKSLAYLLLVLSALQILIFKTELRSIKAFSKQLKSFCGLCYDIC